MSVRVVIADDEALVRAGFRKLLDSEEGIEVVGEASDGREALELAGRFTSDVVLMDIRMPTLDGLEATRRLLARDREDARDHPDDLRPRRVRLRGDQGRS